MKKAVTELSDQELLKLVEQEKSNQVVYDWPNDVMEFISVYNLKQGTEAITTKLLYRLYKFWSKEPVLRQTFSNAIMDIFPSSRIGESVTILLDEKALNISNEVNKYLKRFDKTKSKNWTKHFTTYLDHYSIKKGGLFIKNNVLFNLYDKWTSRNNNYHPLGPKQFNKFCALFFTQKIIRGEKWSGVDKSIEQHLTEDLINLMYNKKASRNGKKENKKKRS